jgi:uncharacterized membrane protein
MRLSKEHELEIIQAILSAEKRTSGEIRVHVESHCEGHPIERSKVLFFQLGMHQTDLQNGVLVYLAVQDRKFSILGDKGIDAHVAPEFWETIRDEMRPLLANNEYGAGLSLGVRRIGEALAVYFPYQRDDMNELSDELSYGE